MNESQTFQRIFLAQPENIGSTVTFFSQKTTFENFLKFVSENFEMRSVHEAYLENPKIDTKIYSLVCKEHGVFQTYSGVVIEPGELEMMQKIGKHLDDVPHTWQKEN